MEKRGAAPQITDNKERLFDGLGFMPREKNVIQKETQPVDARSNGPDGVEHQEEYDALACQTGWGVTGSEERAVRSSPEEAEIISHTVESSLTSLHKKSPWGLSLSQFYQDLIFLFYTGWKSVPTLPLTM